MTMKITPGYPPKDVPDKNIYQRLHAVMGEVDYIQKEKKGGLNYTIVSHDAVTAKVRPILHKHGVLYYPVAMSRSQDGNRTEIDITVRFVNVDQPTDFIDVVACGYGVDSQDKGPGKAISYGVKYCLLKALGLETGDDADNESVEHKPAAKPDIEDYDYESDANAMLAEVRAAKTVLEVNRLLVERKGWVKMLRANAPAIFATFEEETKKHRNTLPTEAH